MSKYIMDIESTGLDIFTNDIIEICVLRVDNKYKTEAVFCKLVKPRKKVPGFITDLTGITNSMVEKELYFHEIRNDLQCFIRMNPIYIFSRFEQRFLATRYGFENQFIDVCNISRKKIPGLADYKLKTMLKYFNIYYNNTHRAKADTIALSFLMKALRL